MHPALRVVLVVIGITFGADLAAGDVRLPAAILGGLSGLAFGEVFYLRSALARLRAELTDIRHTLAQRSAERTTPQSPPREPVHPAPTREASTTGSFDPYARSLVVVPSPPPASASATGPAQQPISTRTPAAPARQSIVLQWIREYFTGGNTLVRAGVVVLFFGVAFLLRYLAEHSHLPIELRLSGIAAGAVVLLMLGWRLRVRRAGYALALQGGAVGILYLTVFSALRLYALLTPTTAFALLVVLAALSATLAVLQDSLAVALLGVTGGFIAPFLAATGAGNHVALFSYFVVLNGVIVGIAWFRSWRPLNLAGFIFTFVLSAAWGVLQYRTQDFSTTEPFLVVFFLLYVAIAILYSSRQTPTQQRYIDATILFGTPISAFGLQSAMLHTQPLALAYSALAVGGLYICLAWLLYRRRGEQQRLLVEAFTALAVAFLTLAIPLAFNGRWSAASWAVEGAALMWVGCRQNRRLPRAFGALLQFAAGMALLLILNDGGAVPPGTYVAAITVGVAAAYASQLLHAQAKQLAPYERGVPELLFIWGLLWWCVGGFTEFANDFGAAYELSSGLAFATLTALCASEFARRCRMTIALLPALALLPLMIGFAVWTPLSLPQPLAAGGWIAWPFAFAGFYWIAWRQEQAVDEIAAAWLHAGAVCVLSGLLSWELSWGVGEFIGAAGAWRVIAWAIPPLLLLAIMPMLSARIRWPLRAHPRAYGLIASALLAVYLGLWSLVSNWQVASPSTPLPYLPLINPLDIVQALVLFALVGFVVRLRAQNPSLRWTQDLRPAATALSALGFVWLNAVLLRTLHQWTGIPYEITAMMGSTLVQSTLSIFWAVLALSCMLFASSLRLRVVWLSGAVLLVVVVLKLFLIDLSSIGTIERIVSFVGVGLLMLIIGYFSPLPPAVQESR